MSTSSETKTAEDLLFSHYLRTGECLAGKAAQAFLETKARDDERDREQKSAETVLFAHYLRTGERLYGEAAERFLERKYNHNHDPDDGRFTFASGGGSLGPRSIGHQPSTISSNHMTVFVPKKVVPTSAQRIPGNGQSSAPYPVRLNLPASIPARDSTPVPIHPNKVREIMPAAGKRANIYSRPLSRAMLAHGIHSPVQQAAFLAQLSVESAHLRHTAENLNYSAERIVQVWPSRFPNVESAKPYAHNPEALANRVYGDRMGNRGIAGAGYRFRGRGLIQVTGRDGYRAIGYENNPEALELPEIAADSAARYWRANNLHLRTTRELTRREFDAVSRNVNGGNHGINERWAAYQRALVALKRKEPAK